MPWTTYSGDEIEAVVAICLCIDNPTATRIKPSRGDKGIDILVPRPDGWVVYQVKSFMGRLTSSQKSQIKKSWQTLAGYMAQRKGTLKEWYLVTPEDPTTEKIEWLEREVTKGFAGPAVWRGGGFVDSLAARHPEVIDYYLRDGKDRLEEKLKSFLAAFNNHTPDGAIDANAGVEKMFALHRVLNACDPHYRYDFAVESLTANGDPPPMPSAPGFVFVERRIVDSSCVTAKVAARYRGATSDRPIVWKLAFRHPSADAAAWRDLLEFGTPFETTTDSLSVDMGVMPGGLGQAIDGDPVRMAWCERSHDDFQLSAEILDGAGEVLSRAAIDIESSTKGMMGHAMRGVGHEAGRVFGFEIRVKLGEKTKFNIESRDVTGADPAKLLDGLRFVRDLRPPNVLRISTGDGEPVADDVPIVEALVDERDAWLMFLAADALAEIQRHCDEKIRFPDLTEVNLSALEQWVAAAKLLRGEAMSVGVEDLQVCVAPEQIVDGLSVRLPFVVEIDSAQISLGWRKLSISAAEPEAEVPHGEHVDLRVVPADGAECVLTWLGADEADGV